MFFYVICGIYCLIYESQHVLGMNCHENEMNKCVNRFSYFEAEIFPNYGESENDLIETCKKMNVTMTCPLDFEHCDTKETCNSVECQKAFKTLQSVKNQDSIGYLYEGLCEEGSPIRERYLKHSSCLKKSSASYNECYNTSVASYLYLTVEKLVTDETICCFHTWLMGCYSKETSATCGEDAEDLIQETLAAIKQNFELLCRDAEPCDKPPLPDSGVGETNDIASTEDSLPTTVGHRGNDAQRSGNVSVFQGSSAILVIAFLIFIFSPV